MLLTVRKNAQITLPAGIRKKAHIEEGDILEAEVRGDEIVLKPKKLIDKSQAWYWTEEWQKGEREADADIAAGRVKEFDNIEDALGYLHGERDR
ncbi:MAG TPA: AbrB/MazE/SpoVT family DNA-binding domain-containing protein [Armatimonadota bacterium]|nr:AbrB/MazE/SpoVT family DNA-binding domain-containing protein [Armatimonadota bacterium]